MTPEEIEYEQNYCQALRNFWLAAKRLNFGTRVRRNRSLQEVLNSRDFDEWLMPGNSLLKRAVNRHGNR